MSIISPSKKEINCKIVYCGPKDAGKSSNLNFIYKKIHSGEKTKLSSLNNDDEKTLFFSFLPLSLGEVKGFKTRFHLYTLPVELFGSSRKLILKGVDGIVFVADAQMDKLQTNLHSLENLRQLMVEQGYDLSKIPLVIQYNKCDLPNAMPINELRKALNPSEFPDFSAVSTQGKGVFETFKSITKMIVESLKKDVE